MEELKEELRAFIDKAHILKVKKEEYSGVSKLNVFKKQGLKFSVGSRITKLNKKLYHWENKYQLYKDCCSLNPFRVIFPYIKLVISILCLTINIIFIIDL